jgi:L-malate glycosyltransferase
MRTADTHRTRMLWLIKGLGPGGAEQLLVNQAAVRDREAFDYRAAYLVPWKHHRVGPLEALDIPVTCLDAPRDLDPRWVLRLRRLLRTEPVDVVHNHSPMPAAITRLLVRTLPRRSRPALVYTEHNRWPRYNRYTRLANQLTFGLDDAQIAVSDDVRDSLPPKRRARVRSLVHGVDLDATRAKRVHRDEVRLELGLAPDEVVIGIVATFTPKRTTRPSSPPPGSPSTRATCPSASSPSAKARSRTRSGPSTAASTSATASASSASRTTPCA